MRAFKAAVVGTVLAIALVFFGSVIWLGPVRAHNFYDPECCNGSTMNGDCQEIPASAVRIVDGGYEITLKPGDHRLVTVPHTWTKGLKEARWSKDENYHACLYPDEATLRCLYVPPLGS